MTKRELHDDSDGKAEVGCDGGDGEVPSWTEIEIAGRLSRINLTSVVRRLRIDTAQIGNSTSSIDRMTLVCTAIANAIHKCFQIQDPHSFALNSHLASLTKRNNSMSKSASLLFPSTTRKSSIPPCLISILHMRIEMPLSPKPTHGPIAPKPQAHELGPPGRRNMRRI